jgi:hypothetical protein
VAKVAERAVADCAYCGCPACSDPELEDDWGRPMCAECFVYGHGRSPGPYWIEGVLIFPDPPEMETADG